MAPEKAPAFQFYPKDFLTDERVKLMSHTERGIYISLLCMCWLEGSLPAQPAALAKLVSLTPARFTRLWKGPLSNPTHTECQRCGAMNSQIADDLDEGSDDESEYCECDNCVTEEEDASGRSARRNRHGNKDRYAAACAACSG